MRRACRPSTWQSSAPAGPRLPTGFTTRIIDVRTGSGHPAARRSPSRTRPRSRTSRPPTPGSRGAPLPHRFDRRATPVARPGPAQRAAHPDLRPGPAPARPRPDRRRFLLYAAGIGAIALIVTAALGGFLVRRTFRPLTRHRGHRGPDRRRRPDPAHRTCPTPTTRSASLSRSLNAMLARIEQSFAVREANEAKMRRFIADASHELRTPLAAVRRLRRALPQGALPTADAVTGAMGRIESEAHRMSGLVEDLLTLARLDGERPSSCRPSTSRCWPPTPRRTPAPSRPTVTSPPPASTGRSSRRAAGDEQQLRQVVTNLVTNARVHTPAGTPIEILVGGVGRAPRRAPRPRPRTRHTTERARGRLRALLPAPTALAAAARVAATVSGSRSCTRSSRRTAEASGSRDAGWRCDVRRRAPRAPPGPGG